LPRFLDLRCFLDLPPLLGCDGFDGCGICVVPSDGGVVVAPIAAPMFLYNKHPKLILKQKQNS
jgi:hypothetical protein